VQLTTAPAQPSLELGMQPGLELGQDTFYGLYATQGTRTLITINIPLIHVPDYIHRPDPDVPTPGNRRVSLSHAEGFKNYLLKTPEWVAPPLILRTDQPLEWSAISNQADVKLVKVRLNRKLRKLGILDGQHRVLGICLGYEEVEKINTIALRQMLEEAKVESDVVTEKRIAQQLENAEHWIDRLEREVIAATIVMEADESKYRQAFFDIADNALGIQQTQKVVFDRRKLLNRALTKALELPLLKGHVDLEVDRVLGSNPNWLAAKSVVDIIRHLQTDNITGRITAKREQELTEEGLVERLAGFVTVLIGAFPSLAELAQNKKHAQELRAASLLSSPVFVRVLASAYQQLTAQNAWTPDQVRAYFALLAPHMQTPLTEESIWVQGARDCFLPGTSAPQSRNQQMRAEVDLVVNWALLPETRPAALKKPVEVA
jgi:hypothetical protein